MNRRGRRAGSRAERLARVIRCPDCNSEVAVAKTGPRRYEGAVFHDSSCPWFRAFERRGGYAIRFGHGND